MATTYEVEVTQTVRVTVDESRFTDEFMTTFREVFYPFFDIEDHVEHIAQAAARELVSSSSSFLEGYGVLKDMGIDFEVEDVDCDVTPNAAEEQE